ncbi:G protein signaling regulator like protein [Dothistroma septosporum NZE10]|uniref:G protein signaling regulator like protein n=1 Tax=Dothistroma septosporum (strain NZE10 / CBS 128990) TaxID=675120 RepID=N1Q457_DOTSN|nr:G protein signaling regulator like protein [Dothistroma septosporum NZE10]
MVYALTYRRPSHVTSSRASLNGDEKQKSIQESVSSGNSCMSHGIPAALAFDRIIDGGTCPPVTVREFMNYLKYIEHSAENLQFFLWYRDYQRRWKELPASDKRLAPEWAKAQSDADANAISPARTKRLNPEIAEVLKDTDFADVSTKPVLDRTDPFNTPPKSGSFDDKRDLTSDYGSSIGDDKTLLGSTSHAHRAVTEQAFEDAGMKWKPFTAQPFREEVSKIVSIYLADGSPRELNLSAKERQSVLHALQHTTHPSAFQAITTTVESSLRRQAHPNFIRWTICNGNRPRVVFARGLGVAGILAGFLADLLITLSHAGRGWRVLPFIGWFIGIATLVAAWKGMCVVLHGLHHRHLRPWELFSDSVESAEDEKVLSSDQSFSSDTRNSFEDEPWVPRYKKRNVIRKIFDREVWIKEPALRQIQDTIFLQALLGAFVASCIVVGIFCAVPHGNLY